MNKLLFVLLSVSITLTTSTASAQALERFRLPVGQRVTIGSETYQGFNLGEYQTLLVMDADLRRFAALVPLLQEQVATQGSAITQLHVANTEASSIISILRTERTRLRTQWQAENKLRLEAENSPSWGTWIAWSITMALSVVVAGLALALILK